MTAGALASSTWALGSVAFGGMGLGLVLLATLVTLRGARPWRGTPLWRGVVAGLVLVASAVALRLLLAPIWPANFVEVERRPLCEARLSTIYPFLVAPLAAFFRDTVRVQGAVSLALAVGGALCLVPLATAWGDRRAGWLAALVASVDPLSVRVAWSADAGAAALGFVPLALLATEVALAGRSVRQALAAGVLWGVTFHLRPEHPGLLGVLVVWWILDARAREATANRAFAWAFGGPVVLSLVLDVMLSLLVESPGSLALPWTSYVYGAGVALFDLTLGVLRQPLTTAAVLLGLVVAPWRVRGVAGTAVLVPLVLVPLAGSHPLGETDWNWRYLVTALPGYALLAGFGASAASRAAARVLVTPWPRRIALTAAAGLLASAPLTLATRIAVPGVVQAEHAFLDRRLGLLPPQALVVVMSSHDSGTPSEEQAAYRQFVAGRDLRFVSDQAPDALVGASTLYYLRGWFEAATAAAALEAWRQRLAARWRLVPLVCDTFRVAPRRDGRDRWPLYCLFQLEPTGPGSPASDRQQ